MYLPEGYEPSMEKWTPNTGTWPPLIVHKTDKIRFILITGGTYRRGDPDGLAPDVNGSPITPHWVRVRSFYIQETEVTNGQVEGYVNRHTGEADPFENWRVFYEKQKQKAKPQERALQWPAARVSYLAARKFARELGGRLPTESEWEFTAKSRESNRPYPWGNEPPVVRTVVRANIAKPFDSSAPAAALVMSFKLDKTDQGVFDMAGNVSELCFDRYKPYAELNLTGNSENEPLEDPGLQLTPGAEDPAAKCVVRGGSFISQASESTTFYRGVSAPDDPPTDVGFRIVVECPPDRR